VYLKSYITKKGENLATIEDVREINSKIEGIKYEFAKLLEIEKSKNYLVSQRLNLYNSQKDDLVFRIFEEANELFVELNSPNLEVFEYKKAHQSAWDNYVKLVNNLCKTINTNRLKLVIFFNKEAKIILSIDSLLKPLLQSTTKLNALDAKRNNRNSLLLKDKVYFESDGEYKIVDIPRMKDNTNKLYGDLREYIEYVDSLRIEFEEVKLEFLSEIENYYDKLRNSINKE
jgi:hypothetical protein